MDCHEVSSVFSAPVAGGPFALPAVPFSGRMMAAPMVRVSTLGFRVLCARHCAQACFTEELVGFKVAKCRLETALYPVPLPLVPRGYAVETACLLRLLLPLLDMTGGGGSARAALEPDLESGTKTLQFLNIGSDDKSTEIVPFDFNYIAHYCRRTSESMESFEQASDTMKSSISQGYIQRETLIDLLSFLAPAVPFEQLLVPVAVEELVHYEKCVAKLSSSEVKQCFKRHVAASFLQQSAHNRFPEGDGRKDRGSAPAAISQAGHYPPDVCLTVVQLGLADPATAARAARVIRRVTHTVDVNMGCPKSFSVQNGMGAALMRDPLRAGLILRAIDKTLNDERRAGEAMRLISFKTRLFDNVEDSVKQLAAVVAIANYGDASAASLGGSAKRQREGENEIGASPSSPSRLVPHAITIHSRTREQPSETPPLQGLAEAVAVRLRKVRRVTLQHCRDHEGNRASDTMTQSADGSEDKNSGKNSKRQQSLTHFDIYYNDEHTPQDLADCVSYPVYPLLQILPIVFNGSVDCPRDAVEKGIVGAPAAAGTSAGCGTQQDNDYHFSGALIGRACMWDPTVFCGRRLWLNYSYERGQPFKYPELCPAHDDFSTLLEKAPGAAGPTNDELWAKFLAENVTPSLQHSLRQLGLVYLELLRHVSAYRSTLYIKYHITRALAECPVSKLSRAELRQIHRWPHQQPAATVADARRTPLYNDLLTAKNLMDFWHIIAAIIGLDADDASLDQHLINPVDAWLFKGMHDATIVDSLPE